MTEERQQILNALDRAAIRLEFEAENLFVGKDYNAGFPYEDSQMIRQAIELLRSMPEE